MNREKFLEIYNRSKRSRALTLEYDIVYTLTSYLEEVAPVDVHKHIQDFCKAALLSGGVLYYYNYALNFYCSKFNVMEAYSTPDQQGRRHFLYAY